MPRRSGSGPRSPALLVLFRVLGHPEEHAEEAPQDGKHDGAEEIEVDDLRLRREATREVAQHRREGLAVSEGCLLVGLLRAGAVSGHLPSAVPALGLQDGLLAEPRLEVRQGRLAHILALQRALVDEGEHREGLDLNLFADLLAARAVHVRDLHGPVQCYGPVGELLPDRRHPLAMGAPRGVELHKPGAAHDILVKVEFGELHHVLLLRGDGSHQGDGQEREQPGGPGLPHGRGAAGRPEPPEQRGAGGEGAGSPTLRQA
mmetsp:Transcript_32114/g.84801  ORF Transcript_32114/g.84801 Transcript_32114/m.84801 type:complete len:260 (+) Transcript_32114:68-847(+)